MNHRTHCWAAAAATLMAGALVGAPVLAVAGGTAAAVIVAPWCDIDNRGSWARRKRRQLSLRRTGRGKNRRWRLKMQVIRWRKHPLKSRLSWLVSLFGPHRRGPTHSLLILIPAGLACSIPVVFIPWWPVWLGPAVAIGLASHPLLDLCNVKPVQLLWPLPHLYRGLGLAVGGPGETFIRWLAYGACAWWGLAVTGWHL
jgi:LexA-binding, inner membrane-associated putative hydrolase